MKKALLFINILVLFLILNGCEDFLNPEQGLVLPESEVPADDVELRSISLGLYSLQPDQVAQFVMLGELRRDLLPEGIKFIPDNRK